MKRFTVLSVVFAASCRGEVQSAEGRLSATAAGADSVAAVLVGAGDIATCESDGDEATAALLDRIAGTVFTLGDNAYYTEEEDGGAGSYTSEEDDDDAEHAQHGEAGKRVLARFPRCYQPSWGRHKARTRPAAGNHDYEDQGAFSYFTYFGRAAGAESKGWYSYNVGAWHVIVLNSNCDEVGCEAGSPQMEWLRTELAAHPAKCTVAYWHHPLFSSGSHGGEAAVAPFWRALYEAGADVVLAGHDHNYERFAPQTPTGRADPARGLRQFVVGTGGAELREFEARVPNSEVRLADQYGVLKLTLEPGRYEWQFITTDGKTADSGSDSCH